MTTKLDMKRVTGTTLIEVMVALIIMSIGLLGLSSLQLTGMNSASGSEKRTQAAIIANDMAERMRANPDGVSSGDYAGYNYSSVDCSTPPTKICEDGSSTAADCKSSEVATYDAFTTWCNANTLLQSGSLTVSCTDQTGTAQACGSTAYRTVTVLWKNQDAGSTPKAKTLTMTFRP